MMREYYFLASLLPTLEIGHIPSLGFVELKELLRVNLAHEDLEKTIELRRQIDIENLRALWLGQSLDSWGNLNEAELKEALQEQQWSEEESFPDYLIDFLQNYPTTERRLNHFSLLMASFFSEKKDIREGFLQEYFLFQKHWRLVMTGFRSKYLNRNLLEELQFEDVTEPLVAEILAQKDAKVYEPPFEFKELKLIFEKFKNDPLDLHRALYNYQFNYLIERWGGELFTVNRILNYMSRLMLVERWLELDLQKGIRLMDEIERKIS